MNSMCMPPHQHLRREYEDEQLYERPTGREGSGRGSRGLVGNIISGNLTTRGSGSSSGKGSRGQQVGQRELGSTGSGKKGREGKEGGSRGIALRRAVLSLQLGWQHASRRWAPASSKDAHPLAPHLQARWEASCPKASPSPSP